MELSLCNMLSTFINAWVTGQATVGHLDIFVSTNAQENPFFSVDDGGDEEEANMRNGGDRGESALTLQ